MSNIDDDAPEFDDLSFDNDGMPDPTAAKQTAGQPLDEDAEAVDDSFENIVDESPDDTDKPLSPKKDGIGKKVAQASPYTVMLAISVLAIGVALLCLIFEWNTYGFQRKPPKNLTMSRVASVQLTAAHFKQFIGSPQEPFRAAEGHLLFTPVGVILSGHEFSAAVVARDPSSHVL